MIRTNAALVGTAPNFNFISIGGKSTESTKPLLDVLDVVAPENSLIDKLNGTAIIDVIELEVLQAGRIFGADRFIIKFKLAEAYASSFTILRGLFDFSRTKAISVSTNTKDQLFEVVIFETQAENLLAYFDTILAWLVKEIKFRESLRAVINFEKRIKHEQEKLYANLKATVL